MRVKCLAQEHHTSLARARIQTTRSGDKHANHEAAQKASKSTHKSSADLFINPIIRIQPHVLHIYKLKKHSIVLI